MTKQEIEAEDDHFAEIAEFEKRYEEAKRDLEFARQNLLQVITRGLPENFKPEEGEK